MSVPSAASQAAMAVPDAEGMSAGQPFAGTASQGTVASAVLAEYRSHAQAEAALLILGAAGMDLSAFSIVGKGCHIVDRPIGLVTRHARLRRWAALGAGWGALCGLLAASVVDSPASESLAALNGPLLSLVGPAFAGAVLGSGLSAVAALSRPAHASIRYKSDLSAATFVLVFNGSGPGIARARALLSGRHANGA